MQRRNTETDNEGPGVARLQKNLGGHRATAQRFSSCQESDRNACCRFGVTGQVKVHHPRLAPQNSPTVAWHG